MLDTKVNIYFSFDGKYMLIFARHQHKIVVYKINDNLPEIIEDIPHEKLVFRKYKHESLVQQNAMCRFDSSGRYLAVYGHHQIVIFDFEHPKSEYLKIY